MGDKQARNTMSAESIDHCAYIIRAWKVPTAASAAEQWRFVLITVDSNQREGFVAVEPLLDALQTELRMMTEKLPP